MKNVCVYCVTNVGVLLNIFWKYENAVIYKDDFEKLHGCKLTIERWEVEE